VGGVLVAMGCLSAGVGWIIAGRTLRLAHRTHGRTASRAATVLDGWDTWFLGGFSNLTMGLRSLYAMAVWAAWTVAGLALIGLGLQQLAGRT